jgi:hypothetical protein
MTQNTKTKIRIFNVKGDREILRSIDSPKSWRIDGAVLRATYQKSETTPLISITTSLPFLVEESDSDEPGLHISEEALRNARTKRTG